MTDSYPTLHYILLFKTFWKFNSFTALQNYLNPNFSIINVHNNARIPGKLASYEIRIHGVTYPKIHEIICKKGYSGSVASLRMFMQKERTRMHERVYLAFFLIIFSKKICIKCILSLCTKKDNPFKRLSSHSHLVSTPWYHW